MTLPVQAVQAKRPSRANLPVATKAKLVRQAGGGARVIRRNKINASPGKFWEFNSAAGKAAVFHA